MFNFTSRVAGACPAVEAPLRPGSASSAASSRPPVRAHVVDPARLTTAARAALVQELYEAQQRLFEGVDRTAFEAYVVSSSAQRTRIQVFRSQGRVVGYAAVHFFLRTVNGRSVWVVRGESGIERAFRGRTMMGRFVFSEAVAHVLRHPLARTVFMACPVHPASYRRVVEKYACSYPAPGRKLSHSMQALLQSLADEFELPRVQGQSEGVRRVGWITRESPEERARWRAHKDRHVRFYIEHNPHYSRGYGMLMLATVSWPAIFKTAKSLLKP